MPERNPSIGSLRWPVVIAQRAHTPDRQTTGITESYRDVQTAFADIQPIGSLTFYGSMQVETPVTHRITMRWLDWIDTTHIIKRQSTRTDGTVREDWFRVRRVKEVGGRKRFIEIEAEQEKRD